MDWNKNGKQDSFDTFMDMKMLSGDLDAPTGNRKSGMKGGSFVNILVVLFVLYVLGIIAQALH